MSKEFESAMKGLREALSISRGKAVPESETLVRDGLILERRENGETTFKLEDALNTVGGLASKQHKSFADFLTAYRRIVNQTQETMAELYGVSVGTYRHWEQDQRKPSASVVKIMEIAVFAPEVFFGLVLEKQELEFA